MRCTWQSCAVTLQSGRTRGTGGLGWSPGLADGGGVGGKLSQQRRWGKGLRRSIPCWNGITEKRVMTGGPRSQGVEEWGHSNRPVIGLLGHGRWPWVAHLCPVEGTGCKEVVV